VAILTEGVSSLGPQPLAVAALCNGGLRAERKDQVVLQLVDHLINLS
jgi:hypothetical protein